MTRSQYSIMAAAILADMLEFFDFFLLGFILSFIVGPWYLGEREKMNRIRTG